MNNPIGNYYIPKNYKSVSQDSGNEITQKKVIPPLPIKQEIKEELPYLWLNNVYMTYTPTYEKYKFLSGESIELETEIHIGWDTRIVINKKSLIPYNTHLLTHLGKFNILNYFKDKITKKDMIILMRGCKAQQIKIIDTNPVLPSVIEVSGYAEGYKYYEEDELDWLKDKRVVHSIENLPLQVYKSKPAKSYFW